MRRPWGWRVCLGVVAGVGLVVAPPALAAPVGDPGDCAGAPWMDRTKSPDERASLVLAQMTLDEKIQEMGSLRDATHSRETPPIPRLCIPALRLNNGSAGVSTGGPGQFPAPPLPAPIALPPTGDPRQAFPDRELGGPGNRDPGPNPLE